MINRKGSLKPTQNLSVKVSAVNAKNVSVSKNDTIIETEINKIFILILF